MDIKQIIENVLDNIGIDYFYIKRPPKTFPCIVYFYNEYSNALGDNKEESTKYDIYINLIVKKDLNLLTKKVKDEFNDAEFVKKVINSPIMFENTDYYQITFNYSYVIAN